MATYLERVAAAGARTGPPAHPPVSAPSHPAKVSLVPIPISLPEPFRSPESAATPPHTGPQAIPPEREPLSWRASPEQPPAAATTAPQPGPEEANEVHQLPDTPHLPLSSDTPVYAPRPFHHAEPPASPEQPPTAVGITPQLVASLQPRLPDRTPHAPLPA